MTVTVVQFNQSPLGRMSQAMLARLKEDSSPKHLTVLVLLQAILANHMEMLPAQLRKHRDELQELLIQLLRMTPEDALTLLIPKEPEVTHLRAANLLAEELQTQPESLPEILLGNLLHRDV